MFSLIHSFITIFISFYAFIDKSNYDYVILCIVFLLPLTWSVYKGECLLSYYYKKYKDPNYVLGSNVISDEIYVIFGDKFIPLLIFFIECVFRLFKP